MLVRKGVRLRGYFDDRREAVLDEAHMVRLNYEAFFFARPENRAVFLRDPLLYCGLLTDPVSKARFRPVHAGWSSEHEGVRYFFESDATLARFRARPAAYVRPGWSM